jgi:hypothetical protein
MPEFARATRGRWTAGLTLCVACSPALAAGQCKLAKLPEFPVTMNQLSPEIVAKINGTDVRLIVDSGAFFSMIDYGSAVALGCASAPHPSASIVKRSEGVSRFRLPA